MKTATSFLVVLILGFIHFVYGGSSRPHHGTLKTFRTNYGDVVDCVDVYKQPAFDHPLLNNHILKHKPIVAPKQLNNDASYERSTASSFVSNDVSCPENTIPIRRTTKEFHATNLDNDQNALLYRFALLKMIRPKDEKFYGALTYISLNNPKCEKGQNSGASIWIGSDLSDQKNFLKAGWMVYPEIYGDSLTRYSIYWTMGFIQVDRSIVLGSPFPNISTHGRDRIDKYFYIYQDPKSKNWWLMTATEKDARPIGYWPKELVPRLRDGGTVLHFGGSTMTHAGNSFPAMADGEFPDGDPLNSGYFRLIHYVNKSNDLVSPPPSSAVLFTDSPRCYGLLYEEKGTPSFQHALYVGGPGGDC